MNDEIASVRWLYTSDTNQQRPALCMIHEGKTLCVQAGAIVRVIVRDGKEFIGMRQASHNGGAYPVKKAVDNLDKIGRRIGITNSAKALLDAIAANDVSLLKGLIFKDEEGQTTMLNDDNADQNNETTAAAAEGEPQKRKLPPPSKKKPAPASAESNNDDNDDQATKAKKETTVKKTNTAKKPAPKSKATAKKSAPKSTAKPAAKKAAPKATKKAEAGEGGFRAGSNMEKGFIAYKNDRAKYQKFERGDKQAWAQKLADKLGTTLNSVRTMISKNWEPLLGGK